MEYKNRRYTLCSVHIKTVKRHDKMCYSSKHFFPGIVMTERFI